MGEQHNGAVHCVWVCVLGREGCCPARCLLCGPCSPLRTPVPMCKTRPAPPAPPFSSPTPERPPVSHPPSAGSALGARRGDQNDQPARQAAAAGVRPPGRTGQGGVYGGWGREEGGLGAGARHGTARHGTARHGVKGGLLWNQTKHQQPTVRTRPAQLHAQPRDTHTHTHTHKHAQTHTHTHAGPPHHRRVLLQGRRGQVHRVRQPGLHAGADGGQGARRGGGVCGVCGDVGGCGGMWGV